MTETVSIEAAMSGWCWALVREPSGAWSLRRLDWRTEELSPPVHVSPGPLEPYGPVVEWAAEHVGERDWTGDDRMLTDPSYPLFRQVLKAAKRAA